MIVLQTLGLLVYVVGLSGMATGIARDFDSIYLRGLKIAIVGALIWVAATEAAR